MSISTYTTKVKLPSGYHDVTIQAENPAVAKEMLEAQYGKGNVTAIWPANKS